MFNLRMVKDKDIMDLGEGLVGSLEELLENSNTYEMDVKIINELDYLELADVAMSREWIRDTFEFRLAGI